MHHTIRLLPLFMLLLLPLNIWANDADIEADIIKSQVVPLLKAENYKDALPELEKLEKMEPQLSRPLTESFYYQYIVSLDKTGKALKAVERSRAYLKKYGRKAPHYKQVVEIIGRVQLLEENERKIAGEFVTVPGGCFQMGDTFGDGYGNEKPVHEVCVSDFRIAKYEVTQGQWKTVMGNNPSNFSSCGDDCPVERVSWNDVQEFCRRLNSQLGRQYRLPTEAEWEYAARSGGKLKKYSGDNDIDAMAWYDGNSGDKTHPVGQKQANGLGIHDMSGNVWEWVQDWNDDYSAVRQRDPHGPSTGYTRVLRGGSWSSNPVGVRTSCRSSFSPGERYRYLGFRLAAPVQ